MFPSIRRSLRRQLPDRRAIRTALLVVALVAGTDASPLRAQETAPSSVTASPEGKLSTTLSAREQLAERLDRIFADPALIRAHAGLTIQVAETGEVLYERAGEKRFTPASNTKLVTGAVGLAVLGPDYRWKTTLSADGDVSGGVLAGDLWIVGSGDPSLTRDDVREWATVLKEAGIRRVTGDVVGDDRVFPGPQWGVGWMWDDLYAGWSAGVSGLQLAPNTVRGYVIPGARLGDPTRLVLRDAGPSLPIANRALTGAPGSEVRLEFVPPPEGGDVELRGWVPLGPDSTSLFLATPHPTLYLLDWTRQVLADADIAVDGQFRRAGADETPRSESWSHVTESDPLSKLLGDMLKPSDNQMAESILRTIAVAEGREGTSAAGLEILGSTLGDWGIEPGAVALSDGSGLSRYNEVTPNAIARMLRAMWRHPDYRTFLAGLPVAGVDGTMRRRLAATPAYDNVRAKTGSLSSVRAVSGYLLDGSGETLVFSLLLNGYDSPGSVAVALEDLLIEQIALYRRPVEPGWPKLRVVP